MSESGLENWNPMAEDYSCTKFNSYTDDVQHQQYDLCSLFVKNVPPYLTQDSFASIFSDGGKKIQRLKVYPPRPDGEPTIGLVGYCNETDAKNAINCLHRKPPLFLQVTYARKKPDDSRHVSAPLQNHNPSVAPPRGRDLFPERSQLTALKVVVDGGKRVACLDPEISKDSKSGKDNQSENVQMPELMSNPYLYCIYCQQVGIKSCKSCKRPYCSQDCQLKDWPTHKTICDSFAQDSETVKPKKKTAPDSSYVSDGSSSSCSEAANVSTETVNAVNKNVSKSPQACAPFKSPVRSTPRQRIAVVRKESFESQANPNKLINVKKGEIERATLAINKNEKVYVIQFQSPCHLWLHLETAIKLLAEMEKEMSSNQKNSVVCAVNDMCCIKENGKFCRAEVLQLNAAETIAHLIDYGTKATVKTSELYHLNPSLKKYPAQAICCNLVDNGGGESFQWKDDDISSFCHYTTGKKYKAHVYKCSNHIYDVSLINEEGVPLYSILAASREEPLSQMCDSPDLPPKVPTVCSTLKPGMDVKIIASAVEDDGAWGLLDDDSGGCIKAVKELDKLLLNAGNEGEDINMYCEEGDIAAGFSQEFQRYFRCAILKRLRNSFSVRYIDYGNKEEISKLRSLSPALLQKPSYVVHCQKPSTLSAADFTAIFKDKSVSASVSAVKPDTVELSFESTHPKFALKSYPWYHDIPTLNPPAQAPNKIASKKIFKDSIAEKKLRMGSKYDVTIVSISSSEMYVQLVDDKVALASLFSEINQHCKSDKVESYAPAKDEIVCCKFSLDNFWYRGQVVNKVENKYSILFVDYGNVEIVTETSIKALPLKFATPKLAACVSVLNIQNQCIPDLLKEKLTTEVWVMDIKDENKPIGVMLSQKGESLVELLHHKTPVVKNVPVQKLPVVSDFKKTYPAKGINEVVICHIEKEVFYCHLVSNVMKFEEISLKLQDCNCKPLAAPPKAGNVLLVKSRNDGCWYRAVFKSVCDKNSEYNVSYVDYGNCEMIPSENVKCLPEEFHQYPFYCFPFKLRNIQEVKKPALNSTCRIKANEILPDKIQLVELVLPKAALPSISSLKKKLLPPDKAVDVSLSHAESDLFYAHMSESKQLIVALETKLEQSTAFLKMMHLPDKGEIVCAKFTDGRWYRGSVKNVFPDSKSCEVFFIDYGNSEAISLDNMKVLPVALCSFPVLAVPIKIQNIEEIQNLESPTFQVKVAEVTPKGVQVVDIVPDKVESLIEAQLLPDSTTDVAVCYKDGNVFYVQKVSDAELLQKVIGGLVESGPSQKVSSNPKVGQLKCVKFPIDGCWYRGVIKEKAADSSFKVFFVDFGNTDVVTEVKDLPSEYSSFPMLSIPVIVSNADDLSDPLIVDSQCIVKYTGKMVGNVQVVRACPPVTAILFSSLNTSPLQGTFEARFLNSDDKFHFICKSSDCDQLLKTEKLLENFASNEIYHVPRVNEVLVVKGGNKKWHRGCVVESNNDSKSCKTYLIDSGLTENVAFCDMSYIPKILSDIPVLLHKVLLAPNSKPAVVGECHQLSLVSKPGETPVVEILHRFLVSSLERKELPIGEERQVMFFHAEKDLMFLQDSADVVLVSKMQEEIKRCAATDVITSIPVLGELFCAHCESDGEWYRCCIEEVESCDSYKVRYVDYGNCEVVQRKSLRRFSDDLAAFPSLSVATQIVSPELTPATLLEKLLTVVAETGAKNNVQAVKLILPDSVPGQAPGQADSATDFYLSVINSQDGSDVKFFHNDMNEVEFNSGEQQIIIYTVLDNCYMYCAPFNEESISANLQLTADITKYCDELKSSTYNKSSLPEVKEMVLAKFHGDNQWYRAVVIDDSKAPTYDVLFIDYGNFEEVHKDSLRKMEKMFMSLEIQAHLCLLTGFKVEDENLMKVTEEIKLFDMNSGRGRLIAIVTKDPNSGNPITVEVPVITKHLVQKELATAI